ncbi:hypothetical protein COO60DRAFT_1541480 [Scenedesmus sp. NREL 46B-D3]|nr:hypothetical protein COO60DRAFT_1541480 [Scenedesmus sp. NREL 46B-D3]
MYFTDQQIITLTFLRAAACTAVVLALSWSPFAVPAASSQLQDHVSDVQRQHWGLASTFARSAQPLLAAFAAKLPLTASHTKAACGALGLISTTAATSTNKETRQLLDWVAELVAAWTRCGMQLALAADIWHQTTTATAHPEAQPLPQWSYCKAEPCDLQFSAGAIVQLLLVSLLLNQTALHVLHPVRDLAAAALECLMLLVNLSVLTWRLQDGLLLVSVPQLSVLAVITRLGPQLLFALWTMAWGGSSPSRGSSSSNRIPGRPVAAAMTALEPGVNTSC